MNSFMFLATRVHNDTTQDMRYLRNYFFVRPPFTHDTKEAVLSALYSVAYINKCDGLRFLA